MKQWRCTVCGYIHKGDTPPEKCPVCNADGSLFEEIIKTQEPSETPVTEIIKTQVKEPDIPKSLFDLITEFILKHHIHPISVHTPNGVLPIAVVLYLIAWIFDYDLFAKAGLINLVFIVLAFPVVVSTGVIEWKNKYNSAMTTIFKLKILSATLTVISCLICMIWNLLDPDVLHSPKSWVFILINLVSLASTGVAGLIGGKLVFKD
jgi:rubredoxin/uncharacterized membrane protein